MFWMLERRVLPLCPLPHEQSDTPMTVTSPPWLGACFPLRGRCHVPAPLCPGPSHLESTWAVLGGAF